MSTPETLIQEIDRLMEGIDKAESERQKLQEQSDALLSPHAVNGTVTWTRDVERAVGAESKEIDQAIENVDEELKRFDAAAPRLLRAAKAEILRQQEELEQANARARHFEVLSMLARLIEERPQDTADVRARASQIRRLAAQPTGEGARAACRDCGGTGEDNEPVDSTEPNGARRIPCSTCKGTGEGAAQEQPSCTWTIDVWDEDTLYETSCDQAFVLSDGEQLKEHGFKFCVYCGEPIKEVRIDRYAEVDESPSPQEPRQEREK